jgi:hypothetical protein
MPKTSNDPRRLQEASFRPAHRRRIAACEIFHKAGLLLFEGIVRVSMILIVE